MYLIPPRQLTTKRSKSEEHTTHSISKLMMKRKFKTALWLITHQGKGSVLPLLDGWSSRSIKHGCHRIQDICVHHSAHTQWSLQAIAFLAKWICTAYVDPRGLETFMACRLIALEKALVSGLLKQETIWRIIRKAIPIRPHLLPGCSPTHVDWMLISSLMDKTSCHKRVQHTMYAIGIICLIYQLSNESKKQTQFPDDASASKDLANLRH